MGLVSSLGRSCGSCRAARAGSASWRLSRTCQAPWPSHGRQGTDSRRRRRRRRRRRPGAPRPPPRLPGRRRRTGEEGGLRGGEGADWRGDAREGRGRERETLVWGRQGAWRRGGATQSSGARMGWAVAARTRGKAGPVGPRVESRRARTRAQPPAERASVGVGGGDTLSRRRDSEASAFAAAGAYAGSRGQGPLIRRERRPSPCPCRPPPPLRRPHTHCGQ